MAKKYDTNPLDGEVLRRAEAARGAHAAEQPPSPQPQRQTQETKSAPTAFFEARTQPFVGAPTVEMPTERFDKANLSEPYQSVFQHPAAAASNSVSADVKQNIQPLTARKVSGLGLPENVLMILPYLPFTIGAIAAVVELLLAARTETRVRFHAAQGLALHIVWVLISVVFAFLAQISGFLSFGNKVFSGAITIFFIISAIRVWRGKPHHIEILDDLTDFLNEKLKPKK